MNSLMYLGKGKGKGFPTTGHQGPEGGADL